MSDKDNELVLCTQASELILAGHFTGAVAAFDRPARVNYLERFLSKAMFIKRRDCEDNTRFKQIIPYIVLRWRQPDVQGGAVLQYHRTKRSGEERLVGQASIGIGGHVNLNDLGAEPLPSAAELHNEYNENGFIGVSTETARAAFWNGARRELREEVRIDGGHGEPKLVGFVNNDDTPVGSVHFGVVLLVDVSYPCVYPADESTQLMRFRSLAQLRSTYSSVPFEDWSRLLLSAGDDQMPWSQF